MRIICILLVISLWITGCGLAKSVSIQMPEPEYWPTGSWKNSTPEAQGMDSTLLADMLEDISANETSIHSVLVIRNGTMLAEAYFHPYTRDTKMHIQSVTKSVIGMLVGKAIADGFIQDETEKLVDFYPNRIYQNRSNTKSSIQLKHLLSMSSGLDCQEFSSGQSMEQTQGWVQFMLDLPMTGAPGRAFGYCNGNAHLLSSILEKTTGMSAREYANQALFQPLGISPVDKTDWGGDPQDITLAGYGLHLRPVDMAKLAFLYLHNGKWEGEQIVPSQWVSDSVTEQVQKEDGSGYGYLWTVYPDEGHYAALGLGGQQIHVYPSRNLIVVVTASLESYAEAPEIEKMLDEFILPAINSDSPLEENPGAYSRLQAEVEKAANPVHDIPPVPETALDVSRRLYTFEENPFGWETFQIVFEPGAPTAQVVLNEVPLQVGLDHIYRESDWPGGNILLRGHWQGENTFILEYPYPMAGLTVLGELGETEFRIQFNGEQIEVSVKQLVFGGEPVVFSGIR